MLFHSTSFSLFLYNIVLLSTIHQHESSVSIHIFSWIHTTIEGKRRRIFFFNLLFYWRIITLQNFVVFCQTSTWISHQYTYIPFLLNLPPVSPPTPPLEVDTEPLFWVSWALLQIPIGYIYIFFFMLFLNLFLLVGG